MVADSSRKNVAIRGLDLELYNEVFSLARKEGKRVSDVMNVALKRFMQDGNNGHVADDNDKNGKFVLRNNGEIKLSKSDIVSLKREVGPFMIENTGRIIFEKDVDRETIKNIENIIIQDGTVEVPKTLYPQFLLRSEIHGKLEKY